MRFRSTILLFVLLLASTASAANLPVLRDQVSTARVRLESVKGERGELERSLGEVAERIEALKLQRAAGGTSALLGSPELDELLKRSQELSTRLSETLRLEREAEQAVSTEKSRLLAGLEGELARLHDDWDAAKTSAARQALIPRIRALRAERDGMRGEGPAASAPKLSNRPTDDPDELLERADAFLDGVDKLRKQEQQLAERIAVLERERELERRMNDFLSEGALFDDSDRRISVSRPPRAPQASADSPASLDDPNGKRGEENGTPVAPSAGGEDTNQYGNPPGVDSTPGGTGLPPATDSPEPGRHGGLDPVPPAQSEGVSLAPPESARPVSAYSEDETLDQLRAKQERLRALADELKRKADETARKARELE